MENVCFSNGVVRIPAAACSYDLIPELYALWMFLDLDLHETYGKRQKYVYDEEKVPWKTYIMLMECERNDSCRIGESTMCHQFGQAGEYDNVSAFLYWARQDVKGIITCFNTLLC